MITQQQVGLMHSQLQSIDACGGMMFRPTQMSFRCLPIFPIGVSFGRLRCQLAAINLLAYGFASKDASRGRFRDSDCSLPPLLFDVCLRTLAAVQLIPHRHGRCAMWRLKIPFLYCWPVAGVV